MFQKNFVVTIRQGGQTLPEKGPRVKVTFNTNYEIRLRNKTTEDSVAFVYVDGRCAAKALVIKANDFVDLERFIEDASLAQGPRFHFVPLLDGRVADKGEPDNGTIEVKFHRIKPKPAVVHICPTPVVHHHPCGYPWCRECHPVYGLGRTYGGNVQGMSVGSSQLLAGGAFAQDQFAGNMTVNNSSVAEAGATVEGITSYQRFTTVDVDYQSVPDATIRLTLEGTTSPVQLKPIEKLGELLGRNTTEEKFCSGCGREKKSDENFCPCCGKKMAA